MPFQLCTHDETLQGVLDRLAEDANAVAPGLGRERARRILDELFQVRVTQTTACGLYPECEPSAPVWPNGKIVLNGQVRPSAFHDPDPYDLPNVFAVACADALGGLGYEGDALEERLAGVFRAGLKKILFQNNRCGRAAICHAPPTDPFGVRGR